MALNNEQINALLAPLNPARVRQVQGNAHLEAWDVRRWLLRIFGWGGWDFTVTTCDLVSAVSTTDQKARHTVVYRVIGRLTIKDPHGTVLCVFEDGATGASVNQPSLGDAHDMALKTAMSQALKRVAMNLGDAYGMGLYDHGKTAAVVGRSLAHIGTDEHDARETVTGGEMDTAPEPAAEPVTSAPTAPAPAAPDMAVSDSSSSSPEAAVTVLRERVIDAMALDRREAIKTYAHLQVEINKQGLASALTTTPGGQVMTLGALVSQALDIVTKKAGGPGNAHADAASGEPMDVAS